MRLISRSKASLLKFFFNHPDEEYYMQQLGRLLGKKPGVFQRNLNQMQKEGILLSEYKANARFFRVNKNYPVYKELKVIVDKSFKLALVILFLFASSTYAQDSGAKMTLKDSILIAYSANKDLQMQVKQIEAAKAGIVDARSLFLPEVDFNGSYTRNDKVLAPANIYSGYKNDNIVGLSFTESLYSGGANLSTYKQSQLSLKAEEETLRAKKLDVEFEAKRLYYGLLLAIETARIAQELVDQAKAHYQNVKDRYEHGTVSRFDLLQSKVQVSLLIPQLVSARNEINILKAQLNKLLARDVDSAVDPLDKLQYSEIKIEENDFLQYAYLNKPEMILKSLGIDIDKWAIKMAYSGYRPQVDVKADYGYRSGNLDNIFNSSQRNWSAGIVVRIPIFDGFSSQAKVAAAKARYAQAKIDRSNIADQIAVDIRQACLDLRESLAIIDSQKDNVGEAQEALYISEVSYDSGVAINLDVLDAQTSLAQVQKNLAEGIYDYLMAEASLAKTMGKSIITEEADEKTKG